MLANLLMSGWAGYGSNPGGYDPGISHHTYEGNRNDTKVFQTVLVTIKDRLKELGLSVESHTVIFDWGKNSRENLTMVKDQQLYYVGTLTPYHHKKLVRDALDNFSEVDVEGTKIQAYRDKRVIWKEDRTVIVFVSDKLKSGQIRGIHQSLGKAEKQLRELKESLENPRSRKRDKEQLENKITSIVKRQFVRHVTQWSLQEISEGKFQLTFSINQEKLGEMEVKLGIRILMTNRHDWSTDRIFKAYYGQSMIEHAFKNLKNPYHLALRPQFHWTDQKNRVHFFICVLGYLLATILWSEAKAKAGFKGTLDTLLDMLNNIRFGTILEDTKTRGRVKATYQLEEMSEEETVLIKALEVENIHNIRLKFKGVGVYN